MFVYVSVWFCGRVCTCKMGKCEGMRACACVCPLRAYVCVCLGCMCVRVCVRVYVKGELWPDESIRAAIVLSFGMGRELLEIVSVCTV